MIVLAIDSNCFGKLRSNLQIVRDSRALFFIFLSPSRSTPIELCHENSEYRWPDGAVYRGEFAKGHRHGEGTYTFADGSTYTGEWSQGRYHGVGQCIWTDGRVYKGEWRDGKAHGYGVEKRVDGTVRHEGMWNNDIPVRKR